MADLPPANTGPSQTNSEEVKIQIDEIGDDLQALRQRIDTYMRKIERSQAQLRATEEKKKPRR